MRSEQEKEAIAEFAAPDLQQREEVSESIIRQKQDAEDSGFMMPKPKKQDEEVELKKKRSSGAPEFPGGNYDWSLNEPDEDNQPHEMNELPNPASQDNSTNRYDITMMDINRWMSTNPKK